jgi:hypothetical protein
MPECLHCGRFLGDHEEVCPACGKRREDASGRSNGPVADAVAGDGAPDRTEFPLDADSSDDSLVAIARFKSSAEAGFFAHELSHTKHIPVSLIVEEHCEGASGRWSMRFALSVPEALAETAARELEQLIEQTDAGETFEDARSEESKRLVTDDTTDLDRESDQPTSPAEESTIHWGPIVLTLAAGSVFLWGVRQLTERPGHQPRAVPADWQQDDLWEQLSHPSGTWTQQIEGGRGRRELWIAPEHNIAIIREDADGDGVFEKEIPVRRKP